MLSTILSKFVFDHPGSEEGFVLLEHLVLYGKICTDLRIHYRPVHALIAHLVGYKSHACYIIIIIILCQGHTE